jgi:hypothetical protein
MNQANMQQHNQNNYHFQQNTLIFQKNNYPFQQNPWSFKDEDQRTRQGGINQPISG